MFNANSFRPTTFGNFSRFQAKVFTPDRVLDGEKVSHLFVTDAENLDQWNLPTVVFQSDVRNVSSFEQVVAFIQGRFPEAFVPLEA